MTVLLVLSVAVMPASAEADKTLKFGEDGKFRILQFADIQDTAFLEYATYGSLNPKQLLLPLVGRLLGGKKVIMK